MISSSRPQQADYVQVINTMLANTYGECIHTMLSHSFGSAICRRRSPRRRTPTDMLEQLQYFNEAIYYVAALSAKSSILLLIARVFRPRRGAVLLARTLVGIMVLYYVPAFFIKLFRCDPIRKTWRPDTEGRCITSEYSILLADCIMSLISDFRILVLPVPFIWQLKTTKKRRSRIILVFTGGLA